MIITLMGHLLLICIRYGTDEYEDDGFVVDDGYVSPSDSKKEEIRRKKALRAMERQSAPQRDLATRSGRRQKDGGSGHSGGAAGMASGDDGRLDVGSSSEECSGGSSDLEGSLSSEGRDGERRHSGYDMSASVGQGGGASRPRGESDASRAGDPHRAAIHRGSDGQDGQVGGFNGRAALGSLTAKEKKLMKELADLPAWASDPNRDIAKPKGLFEMVSKRGFCPVSGSVGHARERWKVVGCVPVRDQSR